MKCQVDKKDHVSHLLLFAFNQDHKAAKSARNVCSAYGGEILQRNQMVNA